MAVCAASAADLEAAGARKLLAASLPKAARGPPTRPQPGRANGVAGAAGCAAGQPATAALLQSLNPNPPASKAGAEAAEEAGAQAAAAAHGAFAGALLMRPGVARAARRHLRALLQGARHAPFLTKNTLASVAHLAIAGRHEIKCSALRKRWKIHYNTGARCPCCPYSRMSALQLPRPPVSL